eukprot:PhF_6_TR39665/c1_g1_i9/m.58888/K00232/E1.3.3.6, ACOX1, ACOX3; acyl-CoA oxidase
MLRRFVFHSSSKGAFPMTMTNNNSVRYCSTYTAAQLDSMSLPEWSEAFKKATIGLASMDVQTITYEQSASRMRTLVKSGILRYDDIVKRPERFFEAHRLLAYHSPRLGPGFWIRFTVHYNLCVGTVVGLGNTQQLQELEQWQNSGLLGCFSLTEKFAGVNSGMIVNTVAEYEPITKSFVITTPSHGAKKNWISQGLVADKTVVVADLKIEGQSVGPHAFMMSLRENGAVVNGVEHGDMGRKTIGNDLDNAWIAFNSVRIPHSALLSRFCEVTPEGRYVQKVKDLPVFHMIGQRLFTGRVAVAQAALAFRKGLFESTKATTDTKLCWSPGGDMALSAIPQLASLYDKEAKAHTLIESFVRKCETELVAVLKAGKVPSVQLVEAIAVAKVKAVEESIDFVHRLKNEVGSLALMADTGFGNTDFLQCCKFAEGDSRILMQKNGT